MTYRDDLAALSARHDALAVEVAQKSRELQQTTQLLDDAKARLRLPVLDNIRVASPCTADWSKMTGDERTRHCGDCKKNVYNLSDMTREEAQALIVEKEGNLCVRYYQRKDGTILLADCTIGVKRARRRRLIVAGAAVMLAGTAAIAVKTGLTAASYAEPEHEHIMGGLEAIEPPPVREVKGELAPETVEEVHVKMGKMMPEQLAPEKQPAKPLIRPGDRSSIR